MSERPLDRVLRLARHEMLPLVVGRVLIGLAGFASLRVLTGVMPPELYGRYALVLGYVGFVAALFVNPFAQAMNRFVHEAGQNGTMRAFLVWGLRTTSLLALVGALGIPFFLAFYVESDANLVLLGLLLFVTLLGANLRDRQLGLFNTFRWRKRYVALATSDAWTKTLAVAAAVMLWGPTLASALLGMTVGTWLLALAGLPWLVELARHRPESPPPETKFEAAPLVRYALPLFGVNALSWLLSSSDRYVVAAVLDEAEVGRYVASCQVALIGPTLLTSAFFPMFTPLLYQRMATHPNEPLKLDRYALAITALSLFVGGLVVADLDATFGILVSRGDYFTGDSVVPFVLLGQLAYALHQVAEHEAHFQKRTQGLIVANGLAALVSLGTNLLLAPRLGIMGAALATLATYTALFTATVFIYRPSIAKQTWARIGAMLAGAFLAIVALRIVIPHDWPLWTRAVARWVLWSLFAGAFASAFLRKGLARLRYTASA